MATFEKVLVIEDDVVARSMIAKLVESLGYVAIQSCDGRQGWETLWENRDIALVITDMMMPDMDGRELIQILRGNEAFSSLPVVIVSGVLSEAEVKPLVDLGHCTFCPKPINPSELKARIGEMLSGSRAKEH
jgi:DNA-binding response OmpR family regulator